MSHPDPGAPPDLRRLQRGEILENLVTGERATVLELPWDSPDGHAVAELTALPGARVVGEHMHPSMHEHFTVVAGELTVVRDRRRSVLHAGQSAHIEPRMWHDWFNELRGPRMLTDMAPCALCGCRGWKIRSSIEFFAPT